MKTKRILSLFLLLTIAAVASGCNSKQAFTKTMTPLAGNVSVDIDKYTKPNPDGDAAGEQAKEDAKELMSSFNQAIMLGEREQAFTVWFGVPPNKGLREVYEDYLDADPLFTRAFGADGLRVKKNNIQFIDYVLSRVPVPTR